MFCVGYSDVILKSKHLLEGKKGLTSDLFHFFPLKIKSFNSTLSIILEGESSVESEYLQQLQFLLVAIEISLIIKCIKQKQKNKKNREIKNTIPLVFSYQLIKT